MQGPDVEWGVKFTSVHREDALAPDGIGEPFGQLHQKLLDISSSN
jgi:hypothetical protein